MKLKITPLIIFISLLLLSSGVSAQNIEIPKLKEGERIVKMISKNIDLTSSQKSALQTAFVESRVVKNRSDLRTMTIEDKKAALKKRKEIFMASAAAILSAEQYSDLETLFNRGN